MSYEDRTKDELQDELRQRELPVSGSKDDLIERLEEDDRAQDGGRSGSAAGVGRENGGEGRSEPPEPGPVREQDEEAPSRLTAREAIRSAVRQLAELGGRPVCGVTGLQREDGQWRVWLEAVEVSRVPASTDVLGQYRVTLDEEGELVAYERLQRYVRAQAGGEEA